MNIIKVLKASNPYSKSSPNGLYYPSILCAACDNFLGRFDSFACKFLFSNEIQSVDFRDNTETRRQGYRLKNKEDYRKIDLFFISILWRASISKLINKNVEWSLGPYQAIAKEAILNEKYDYHRYFSVIITHFCDLKDSAHFLNFKRIKIQGVCFYQFFIGFYSVLIKCDKQKTPSPYKYISTSQNVLMIEDTFKNSQEAKLFSQLIKRMRAHYLS